MKDFNYSFFKELFDVGWSGWKNPYFNESQNCFEKYYKPKGFWEQHPEDEKKFGYVDEKGKWHWSNRANTHPKFCWYIYNECIKKNPNFFIDFQNPIYFKENAKRMWNFVYKNFNQYFKPNGLHYNNIKKIFENSWNNGNISMIAVVIVFLTAFNDISKIEYSFDYGDDGDMCGIDATIFLSDGKIKTIQIKSGSYIQTIDGFIINGSPNSLEYTTDWYGYAEVLDIKGLTKVIIFENSNITKDGTRLVVPKENILYHKEKNMEIPQLLKSIMNECGKKDISFTLSKEGEKNSIDLDVESRIMTITIVDPMDKNLVNELKICLENLK